jgi:ParB family transcriptional regulator, chromosome partitioning protein
LTVSKRALGKGLEALIHSNEPQATAEPKSLSDSESLLKIAVDRIDPADDQPRKHFDDARLAELAESIRRQGIIQPIVVEKNGDRYMIVAGERRFRAAKIAGLAEVPVVVAAYGAEKRRLVSLIENLQREDLDPIEEAEAYRSLIEQSTLTQETLAEQIGKSRAAVANSLRLLNLSDEIKSAIRDGELSAGHARALLAIPDEAERDRAFRKILSEGLSVREVEEIAKRHSSDRSLSRGTKPPREPKVSSDVQRIEQQFIEALGTKVRLKGSTSRGTLEITYFSKEDLERLFDLIVHE